MLENRISYLVIFTLLLLFTSASADSLNCKDFLQELVQKPTSLKFQSCEKVEEVPAVLLKATYEVSGKNAKQIETFLHKNFGLKRLRTYKSSNGDTYSVNMYSLDEFSHQETWEDYQAFRVIIGKFIVLP